MYEAVEAGRAESASIAAKKDRVRRKWLMEGSFADAANNHGFKRARWRRLWRQRIQDYMIAAVQNVRILIKERDRKPKAVAVGEYEGICALLWSLTCVSCGHVKLARVPSYNLLFMR